MEKRFSISDAAKQLAVEAHVLRYWEVELGLQISRNHKGYRYYEPEDIKLLQTVKDLKEQGFQLRAIKMLLPDIESVRHMEPQKLYRLREELNQQIQMEEAGAAEIHTAQVMPLHPRESVSSMKGNASDYDRAEEKLRHFEAMMRKMIRNTIEEMEQESEERICEKVTTRLMKEINYLSRQKEELQERQIKLLHQILGEVQQGLPEAAVSGEDSDVSTGKKEKRKKRGERKKLFAKGK